MDIPLENCSNDNSNTPKTAAARMRNCYTGAQIQKYGVIGIEIAIMDTEMVLKQLEGQKETEFERLFPDGMK